MRVDPGKELRLDCLAQIARYVAEQAQKQLWPSSANRVAALLTTGDQAGAVFGGSGRKGGSCPMV